MENISNLVRRLSNLLDRKELAKKAVSEAVERHTGRELPPESIFIKDSVLEMALDSDAFKSEIKLKEGVILRDLKESRNMHFQRVLYK